MDPLKIPSKLGPEQRIQKAMTAKLRDRGWFVKRCHGNEFQVGFPDVFACHSRYGSRWVEFKLPKGSKLEQSQVEVFTKLGEKRVGVWILTSDSEAEYKKLFLSYNWYQFLDVMKVVTRTRESNAKPWGRSTRLASTGPERDIQEAVKAELDKAGWYVLETHGNMYSQGFADLYATHRELGGRWIEIKKPIGYTFTPAQIENFPKFCAHGSGVWILDGVGQLDRLARRPNWYFYLETMK